MRAVACWVAVAIVTLVAPQAFAQSADEVVEKYLSAIGGRPALARLESRIARGIMTVSVQLSADTPRVDMTGPVEVYSKAPNKVRNYVRFDLSQMGMGEAIVDQRCDGKSAYQVNTVRGDRDITGNELQILLNNAVFPTPLLDYKRTGGKVELTGKDTVGDRPVYVVLYTPKAGSPYKEYFDAENYLLLRVIVRIDTIDLGGETDQTVEFRDYRDVDGVKVPFAQTMVNGPQTVTIAYQTIEHNKPIDEAMFSKPAPK